jgi:hypothetical protein
MQEHWSGTLRKMTARLSEPVSYEFVDALDPQRRAHVNELLGRRIRLSHEGAFRCIHCGGSMKKPYGEGSCYPCFIRLPQNDICIVKPELCHFHNTADPCRDPAWGERNCFIPHLLYLAAGAGLKVGITRHTQVPTRWIDQGASRAVAILRLPDRLSVGRAERLVSEIFPDRTPWQKMLRHELAAVDLEEARDRALAHLQGRIEGEVVEPLEIVSIDYPALGWPSKVRSVNLERSPAVEGRLLAVKGQYLLLEELVINLRKHSGFLVRVEVEP